MKRNPGDGEFVRGPRSPWVPVGVFVLLALGLAATGQSYYHRQRTQIRNRIVEQLQSIADLKVQQFSLWRSSRMGEAAVISESLLITQRIREFLSGTVEGDRAEDVVAWMLSLRKQFDFDSVALVDTRRQVRLTVGEAEARIGPHAAERIGEILHTGLPEISDFHRVSNVPIVHLDLYVPVLEPSSAGATQACAGVLLIRIDPRRVLYPMIAGWPTPSETGETLLAKQEGREIFYLNEPRFGPAATSAPPIAVREPDLAAHMVRHGYDGVLEGPDYRGVGVIAAARRVPGMPWRLISKVDAEEIYAPIRREARLASVLFGSLIMLAGLAVGLWWQQRQSHLLRVQYEGELRHTALTRHFEYLTRHANDIVLLADAQGRISEANERALQAYGYTREEFLALHVSDLGAPETSGAQDDDLRRVEQRGGLVFETVHRRKDGSAFPVEVSARKIDVEGRVFFQSITRDITERKQIEQALADREQFLVNVFDSIQDGISVLDTDLNIVRVNPTMERRHADSMPLEGRKCYEAYHGRHEVCEDCPTLKVLRTGRTEHAVQPKRGRDGRLEGWTDLYTFPLIDPATKQVHGAIEYVRDVTEQKTAENSLRATNRALRVISQCNQALVRATDEPALISRVCQIMVEDGGYRQAWIALPQNGAWRAARPADGTSDGRGFPAEMDGLCAPAGDGADPVAAAMRDGEGRVYADAAAGPGLPAPWREHAGRNGYRSVICLPLVASGDTIGVLVLHAVESAGADQGELTRLTELAEDVAYGVASLRMRTARRRAEEEIRRLARVVEQTGEAVLISDAGGRVIYVNPAFQRITGFPAGEVVGQSVGDLWAGDTPALSIAAHWEALRRGDMWEGRTTNRRLNGEPYEVEVVLFPIRDAAGVVGNYAAVFRDVTRERLLERQFLQAQKMEAIGRLAGGVAHDFNNLLQVIVGFCGLLQDATPESDPRHRDLLEIDRAAEQARALTSRLLAFGHKQRFEPAVLDLNVLVAGAEKMWRRLLGEDVAVVTQLEPLLWRVKADPGQVEQILMNLVINARDAMPEGGMLTASTANVQRSAGGADPADAAREGNFVCVSIADSGMGMSEEVKTHLFEPFFTTKGLGKGTGLGLATAYTIAKQHGGWMEAESREGWGSTLRLYLPAVPAEVVQDQQRQGVAALSSLRGNGERVLLVEDEAGVRDLASRVLGNANYALWIAPTAADAVRMFAENSGNFDLLLSDVVLPDRNGLELAEELTARKPGLRVILASGYTDERARWEDIQQKGYRFLSKPYAIAALLKTVREVLAGATAV